MRLLTRLTDGRGLALAGGLAALVGALSGPLDARADRWLAAHMVQHELLMVVAAPLLVYGRSLRVAAGVLPRATRRRVLRVARAVVPGPLTATLLHGVAVWLWHLPALHEVALRRPVVHVLEHVALMGTALLFWQAIADHPRRYGVGVFCVFLTTLHTTALGAFLALSSRAWFTAYAGSRGLSGLEDQQVAGLVMWVPGGMVLTIAGLCLAAGWLRALERAPVPTLVLVPLLLLSSAACNGDGDAAHRLTGGDPSRGPAAVLKYGCHTCHAIPGVPGATGTVGPPLTGLARRTYIAGHLENSPRQLIEWIRHPQHLSRSTAMPEMGVTEADGRDIAAYLYTLR